MELPQAGAKSWLGSSLRPQTRRVYKYPGKGHKSPLIKGFKKINKSHKVFWENRVFYPGNNILEGQEQPGDLCRGRIRIKDYFSVIFI